MDQALIFHDTVLTSVLMLATQLQVALICQPSYINPTSLNLKKLDSEVVLVLGLIIHVCGEANDIDKVDEVGGEGEPVP